MSAEYDSRDPRDVFRGAIGEIMLHTYDRAQRSGELILYGIQGKMDDLMHEWRVRGTLGYMATGYLSKDRQPSIPYEDIRTSANLAAIDTIRDYLQLAPSLQPGEALLPEGPSAIYQLVRVPNAQDATHIHTALIKRTVGFIADTLINNDTFSPPSNEQHVENQKNVQWARDQLIICAWDEATVGGYSVQLNPHPTDTEVWQIMRSAEENLNAAMAQDRKPSGPPPNVIHVVPHGIDGELAGASHARSTLT